jgi:hypothetical protein
VSKYATSLAVSFLRRPEKRSHEKIRKVHAGIKFSDPKVASLRTAEWNTEADSATRYFHASYAEKIGQAFFVAKFFRKDACPKVAKTPESRKLAVKRVESCGNRRHSRWLSGRKKEQTPAVSPKTSNVVVPELIDLLE